MARRHDEEFREAGFEPNIVQRASDAQRLLDLVAAGVGLSRLPFSRGQGHPGVVFVPLAGAEAVTEMVWLPEAKKPALRRLLEVVTELAATTGLTPGG
ncbi:MAG TPA: LysR substrate-binding domain-containing protein [Amycolatopsis sp.]|nr:LysR substrate-binding domain-containing protein [Amycolatopsis sp.]